MCPAPFVSVRGRFADITAAITANAIMAWRMPSEVDVECIG